MKVAVFGASGGIGKHVVKHAINKGYEVVAYLRDPSKLKMEHKRLVKVQGEINQYKDVKRAIVGCDAVIWCVGVPMKKYKDMESLEGHKILVKAMKEVGITRIIDWATPSVSFEKDKKSFITVVPSIMAGLFLPVAKKELNALAKVVTSSDLNWTIVRFMAPKDTPYTGNVKVCFGEGKLNFNISREDIAAFMVNQLEDKKYERSMPIIGS